MRLLLALLALVALAAPARADDISVAGRGVVRVVVVTFEDGQIVDLGHGSGFAVAPGRIVTNAHVVAPAAANPEMTTLGVVPSEGSRAFGARILAVDRARDLALLQLTEGAVPHIPLFAGRIDDGAPVAALGYPGNVDLATARSPEDYVTPLPPTRSVGIFSNLRPINGIATLLHTANIARGHSGGPLLDRCGRVLGVNALITRGEDGDAPFAFAVANSELTAFLRAANQPFQTVATECVDMADRLREEEDRQEAEERTRQAEAAARQRASAEERARRLGALEDRRELMLALAVLLLALALVAAGGAGIMLIKDRQKPATILGAAAAALMLAAIAAFLSRPGRDSIEAAEAEARAEQPDAAAPAGRRLCRLVPERSRVTVSSGEDVVLDWSPGGCVDGTAQYARSGAAWTRVIVPDDERTVSVLGFTPAEAEYVVQRYALGAEDMARLRALRGDMQTKACIDDPEARTLLADRQREIEAALPELPNERLVYRCGPAPPGG